MASNAPDHSFPSVHRLYVPVEGSRAGGRPLQMCYLRSRPLQLRGPERSAQQPAADAGSRIDKKDKAGKSGPSFDFVSPRTEFLLATPRLDAALMFPISIIGPPSGKRKLSHHRPALLNCSIELEGSQAARHEGSPGEEDNTLWTAWDLHILRELVLQSLRSEDPHSPADQPGKRPRHDSAPFNTSSAPSGRTPGVFKALAQDVCGLSFSELLAFFVPDPLAPAQDLSSFPWNPAHVLALCTECARANGGALPLDLADCLLCHVLLPLLHLRASEKLPASSAPRGSSAREEARSSDSSDEEAVLQLVRLALPASSIAPLDPPSFSIALSALEWEGAGEMGQRAINEAAIAHWRLGSRV